MFLKLSHGDTFYLCSPAKAIDKTSINFAQNHIESQGFQVELSKHILGSNNYFSGTEEERLEDLQTGLDHPQAKAILCARGGYGCIQLIEKLDWTKFKNNPKWIIGYSDITILHLALNKMRIPSLHATMPLNFEKNTPVSLSSLFAALTGKNVELQGLPNPNNKIGFTKNIVVGGNLAIVHAMLTSLDDAFFTDKILFLEDVGEHLYQIDRMFYGLKFLGALANISGLILGGFTSISDTDSPFGKSLEEIILNHVKHRNIPVAFDLPCGHQDNNQAIILGATCSLNVTKDGSFVTQFQNDSLS